MTTQRECDLDDRPNFLKAMEPTVWFGSAGLVIAFCVYGGLFTEHASGVFTATQAFIAEQFGWFYIMSVTFFVGFVVWLFFSPYGHIKLGSDDDEPEFSYFSWFTMLFSAGMGIGLVFWGIAEPIMHYQTPPLAGANTPEAVVEAMKFTFFHWGFHPWAVYIIFALGIAYYHFRHGLPLAPRSLLYPIIGDRFRGMAGHLTDILCTVGTLFGVATSLGLGAMQINAGIAAYTGIPFATNVQIWIITLITLVATVSVVSGIERGIRLLSGFNVILAGILLLFVFIAGPTVFQLKLLTNTLGSYLSGFVDLSLWMDLGESASWQKSWTIFYWGWWISWSPFVGIFIARISKGRTIREFVLNVFLAPTAVTFLWLAVFGGTGLHMELFGGGGISEAVSENVALSLNAVMEGLPFSSIMPAVATLLVITFFITSSDSGSLVDDMVTSGGHPDPPVAQRIFWAFSEGAVAGVLLYSGGLAALQTASITSGLPLTVLILFTCYGLVKALRIDAANEGQLKGLGSEELQGRAASS
jgi:choline/glycine/proline betaine transport protein